MKACSHCRLHKSASDFHRDTRSKDGRCRRCKECVSAYQEHYRERQREIIAEKKRLYAKENRDVIATRLRKYADENREKLAAYQRDYNLRRKYNLTATEWDAMFEAQGRVCAICNSPEPNARHGWHTDHCHTTGHVRGILCHPCNMAIGNIKDSPETAMMLYSYLSGKLPFAS